MRKEFKMTEKQFKEMMEACKPIQELVNKLWAKLGDELNFKAMTARPVPGKGVRYFTAEED